MFTIRPRSIRAIFGSPWAIICLLIAGCGAVDRSPQFIPTLSAAEAAVRAGMEAWKKGEPVGAVAGTKPVVHVIDSQRKPGRVLRNYEILGEVPGNAPRCFAVKVELAGVDAPERLRFIVVGIEPMWVFRQEDYDMLSHWEHPMEEKSDQKTEPGKSSGG